MHKKGVKNEEQKEEKEGKECYNRQVYNTKTG